MYASCLLQLFNKVSCLFELARLMITTFSSISLVLRRCHDIGFSGKVTALIVIVFSLPLVNLLFAIILASIKSQKGRNIYG